ncbi:rod shape-determining protein MreC [Salipiger sp. PrR002]|uniref:rod shape-determining protein MreC n=1 Tax=Salipiger sp. PrR002 TaxID=2706489 RepID=UPI0013B6D307|nr:rod shape-determining protein MreC [Salipiger sp. PrR002]NDW00617.1 rod shape-determining protein MreC [Salipiger sp. PrR002]NDW57788.1 rod shape-determining protein MreC [Salipiger sp. PrR004]
MAKNGSNGEDYSGPLKRLLLAVLILCLAGLFILWRIDSPRVERFRAQVIDTVMPGFDWAMAPVTGAVKILRDFQSYQRIHEQNQELRRELRQMTAWKEAALQLEQQNAKLRDLNNVQLDPRLTYITGVVLADSGSPFRQSVLINVGSRDGIVDGWATMDGIGLVGRISGVGNNTARVILLTDATSRIPATIQPSGQRAMVVGDNSANPPIDFLENPDLVKPGDRIVTSGDGEVFPPGILIGQVAQDPGGRLRVRLAADYERLEFLRVLRDHGARRVNAPSGLILPEHPPESRAPEAETDPTVPPLSDAQEDGAEAGNG